MAIGFDQFLEGALEALEDGGYRDEATFNQLIVLRVPLAT